MTITITTTITLTITPTITLTITTTIEDPSLHCLQRLARVQVPTEELQSRRGVEPTEEGPGHLWGDYSPHIGLYWGYIGLYRGYIGAI